jgi:hypothetical protein
MKELDKLLIKNLQTRINNNKPCAFITIETSELKRLLDIVKKEEKD